MSCKFSPNGKSLYVLGFGVCQIIKSAMHVFAHAGVLWKITEQKDSYAA